MQKMKNKRAIKARLLKWYKQAKKDYKELIDAMLNSEQTEWQRKSYEEMLDESRFTRGPRKGRARHGVLARYENWLDKLEAAEQAERATEIEVSVTWKRSRQWGWNPTAEARVKSAKGEVLGTGFASAGGYGYDKRCQAIVDSLNDIPAIRRLCIEHKDCWSWSPIPRLENRGLSYVLEKLRDWGFDIHEVDTQNYYSLKAVKRVRRHAED